MSKHQVPKRLPRSEENHVTNISDVLQTDQVMSNYPAP